VWQRGRLWEEAGIQRLVCVQQHTAAVTSVAVKPCLRECVAVPNLLLTEEGDRQCVLAPFPSGVIHSLFSCCACLPCCLAYGVFRAVWCPFRGVMALFCSA